MALKPTLSAIEWLGMGGALLRTLPLVLVSLFMIPFQRSKGPPTLKRHVNFKILRAFTTNLPPKALLATSATTDEAYQTFVKDQGLTAQTITLPDGTRAHCLGDLAVENILLFFHGGGYLMYGNKGHFQLLNHSLHAVEQKGSKLAVLFLSYDSSLQAPYPRQLQQAAALLNHTLTVLRKKPRQILLAGDSAGGNLSLALLSHMLHPHPQVEMVNMHEKLGGVALLSPWVTFNTSSQSMQTNHQRDVLAVSALEKWATLFRGSAPTDPYLDPLSASEDWWQNFPAKKVLIVAGADELFVDDIRKFAAKLSSNHKDVIVHAVPGEAHDHLVMEFMFQESRTQQREIFEMWLCEVMQR